jgi:hypothetical protein
LSIFACSAARAKVKEKPGAIGIRLVSVTLHNFGEREFLFGFFVSCFSAKSDANDRQTILYQKIQKISVFFDSGIQDEQF